MPHLSAMVWNAENVLSSIVNSSIPTYYQYSNGQRVRKYTDKGSIKEERVYLGNFELYRKYNSLGAIDVERQTVHVSDDTGRIAMLETLTVGSDGSLAELERYIYSNHLQSATLELDDTGEIISYEEYHPYGTTAYQAMNSSIAAVAKRYRYTGKERDEETGLYYHEARYYIPWLCRWTAVDPLEAQFAGRTPYCYAANNPVVFNDPSGQAPEGRMVTNPAGEQMLIGDNIKVSEDARYIYSDGGKSDKSYAYIWNDEGEYYDEISSNLTSQVDNVFNVKTSSNSGVDELLGFVDSILNFTSSKWESVTSYLDQYEFEATYIFSSGIQAGFEIETPYSGIELQANILSVDLVTLKDIINGKDDGTLDYATKDYWMNLRQGAGINLVFGGVGIEREMKNAVGGGAFLDKKVTTESNILSYTVKTEYYQEGLYTTEDRPKASSNDAITFGAGVKFLIGIDIKFEIRKKQ